MADVESPDGGGGTAEAEPAECCRCTYTCAMGFFFVGLVLLSLYTVENFRPASKLLAVVAGVLVVLASLLACWFAAVFIVLVAEWFQGSSEGQRQRFVDGLIQSDRRFFQESVQMIRM